MLKIVSDIYYLKKSNKRRPFALYKCLHCGNIKEINVDNVVYLKPYSCGCCRPLKKLENNINGLEVLKDLGMNNNNPPKREAIFQCLFCDNSFKATINTVKTNQKKSCGCLKHEPSNFTHLKTKHPLYRKWSGMKVRCYSKKDKRYNRYGGRGITICDEWLNDFQSFYDWAISTGWEEGLTIDRINNDGNYEPSNCQWLTIRDNTLKDMKRFKATNKEKKQICKMYVENLMTITNIAIVFKTHKGNISKILRQNNIEIKKGNTKRCTAEQS